MANPAIHWPSVVAEAARIVESYDTAVTLRQLFYRLVSAGHIPNTQNAYKRLSSTTAIARRAGTFPDLIDRTRDIHLFSAWSSPASALRSLADQYRRDRTEGQETAVYLGVEKNGMIIQLQAWFGELGFPVLAVGGYPSQSYVDEIRAHVGRQGRKAVLLYAGDFDPSGEDILRDFVARTDCFDDVVQIALTLDQVTEYDLPPLPGKATDSRAAGFQARHGMLVQVELDALDPNDLRALYQAAVTDFWDESAWEESMAREEQERTRLRDLADDES